MVRKKQLVGQSLVKRKTKRGGLNSDRHICSTNDDFSRLPVRSVTEETTMSEFFEIANLANFDFSAQKKNVRLVDKNELTGLPSSKLVSRNSKVQTTLRDQLKIPRRPKWNREMSADELDRIEKDEFLKWRRSLATLEHTEGVVMTPFEKNLQLWRQLWRVVERSDVLVQIVDARQPLLYFCPDFETYAHEVDSKKVCVLLVNKSDFLTTEQRLTWAAYFEKVGIRALFWSAMAASNSTIPEDSRLASDDSDMASAAVPSVVSHPNSDSLDQLGIQTRLSSDHPSKEESEASGDKERSEKMPDMDVVRLLTAHELLNVLSKTVYPTDRNRVSSAHLTVGFVGYPNVGKSSTMNALMGCKKTAVSSTPGRTKHFQTLHVQPDLVLCDCPGLVMPSFVHLRADLVTAGILSIDEMRDCLSPIGVICQQIPREVFELKYGINLPKPSSDKQSTPSGITNHQVLPRELLAAHAFMHGFMTAKGNPHYDRSARLILKDYVQGQLLYCHPPPGVDAAAFQFFGRSKSGPHPSLVNFDAEKLSKRSKLIVESSPNSEEPATVNSTLISAFDRMAFTKSCKPSPHIQSRKRIVRSTARLLPSEQNDDDGASSTSSWETTDENDDSDSVSEQLSTTGVSRQDVETKPDEAPSKQESIDSFQTSAVAPTAVKKPWRLMSQSKRTGAVRFDQLDAPNPHQLGRGKKQKEKLRRVYAHLDQHENM